MFHRLTGMFKAGILVQVFFLAIASPVKAQELEKATKSLEENRRGFSELITTLSLDTALARKLTNYSDSGIDDLLDEIRYRRLKQTEKIFVQNSIGYLLDEIRRRVDLPKIDWYDLPGALASYKKVLFALVSNQAYRPIVEPLSEQRTHLIARATRDHRAGTDLMHLATYKYYEARPEEVLSFLEREPGYPYADSLIVFMAANHPRKLAAELKAGTSYAGKKLESHPNMFVRQVALLAGDPEAELLMPFVVQIARKQLSREAVLSLRRDSAGYFKLLVDARKEYLKGPEKQNIFGNVLINAIRETSVSTFANRLNEMHDAPREERFAIVKDLGPEDLYYILATAGDELYTSSYLGLYSRMQVFLKTGGADSLFASLGYDRFRDFLKIAANYNTLGAVFAASSSGSGREMLARYIDSIEREPYSSLEKAMDVADCFTGLAGDTVSRTLIRESLRANYERCTRDEHVLGARLYGLLLRVFEHVANPSEAILQTVNREGYNERLSRSVLRNKKGEIVTRVTFYGDNDGKASFRSFRNLFRDNALWEIEETAFWIRIRSRGEEPVIYYANLPLDHEKRLDLQAQDTLSRYLSALAIEPTVLVHRGHSYYIDHTMAMMSPAIRLAVLGACGGNNFILDFAAVNPDVQIVFSKKIGKTAINDSILGELAGNFLEKGKDVLWSEIRHKLENRFRSDPGMLNHFHEYIFPPHNVSILFLNLFNREL